VSVEAMLDDSWANDPNAVQTGQRESRGTAITTRRWKRPLSVSPVKFTLRSLHRPLLRVTTRLFRWLLHCHVPLASHGNRETSFTPPLFLSLFLSYKHTRTHTLFLSFSLSLSAIPERRKKSALTRPSEGTPGNQQNEGHRRRDERQGQQRRTQQQQQHHQHRQQQRGGDAGERGTSRTGGGFRGRIPRPFVVHHVAGYRRAVGLRRGAAYRGGVHCVAGVGVVRGIPGAAAGVVTQAGGVRDRVRDVALVEAAGEQGGRERPDGEHRHVLATMSRPRPRHTRRL